jgi:acyl carrier protein
LSTTREQILEALFESITALNEQRGPHQQLSPAADTPLGEKSGLDSLGFVNLVAIVEEKCQERFHKSLVLTDAAAKSDTRDPFESVGTLAEYIELALAGNTGAWR